MTPSLNDDNHRALTDIRAATLSKLKLDPDGVGLALVAAFRPRHSWVDAFITAGEPFAALVARQHHFNMLFRGADQSAQDFVDEVSGIAVAILDHRWLEVVTRVVAAPLLERQLSEVTANAVDLMTALSNDQPNGRAAFWTAMYQIVDRLESLNDRMAELESSQADCAGNAPPLPKPKGTADGDRPA